MVHNFLKSSCERNTKAKILFQKRCLKAGKVNEKLCHRIELFTAISCNFYKMALEMSFKIY